MGKFDDWNTKLLSLTPDEFEELCYELVYNGLLVEKTGVGI
jgi:hypothetical protein